MRSAPRPLRAVLILVAAVALLASWTRPARAALAVDLYTVGQGSYLYATYGHSIVCVREREAKAGDGKGQCYDYGVADSDGTLHVLWASLRGQAIFTPVKVDDRSLIAFFEAQGRAIDRQTLALSESQADVLAARLEQDVRTRWSYAYHPYFANCATQLRDRIDEAAGGRLRKGLPDPGKATFRERMEAGLSGRIFELAALALVFGTTNERAPNGWEAMYLPDALRDGAKSLLHAPVESIAERQAVVLPTTPAVGRLFLFAVGFVLFVTVRLGLRTKRLRAAIAVVSGVLGLLGTAVVATAAVSTWPELSRSWTLLLLVPFDLAMPWTKPRALAWYARVRIAVALLLAAGELAGLVGQPVLATVALVVLPMSALLGALEASAASTSAETDVRAAASAKPAPARAA